jgi:5-methyltetrahydropteroyltriglutamate--homocysteine methyltransferase
MEMTKWFDTNYHYIVPEFTANQQFSIFSEKVFEEFNLAKQSTGGAPKTVLIGPVSYLLLGKEKEQGFEKISLIKKLVPVYIEILKRLKNYGAEWIQFDEPFLAMDLSQKEKDAFTYAYSEIKKQCPELKTLLTTYFESLDENTPLAVNLAVTALHIDLVRAPHQLDNVLTLAPEKLILSLGVIDGRNIWKNDYIRSLAHIKKAIAVVGKDRLMIATSCSLLHTPFDLELETSIDPEIRNWMAFAKQKLNEISELHAIIAGNNDLLVNNIKAISSRNLSKLIHKPAVKERVLAITDKDARRNSEFTQRQQIQQQKFNLPLFPTTTIGSFPQTDEIRQLRSKLKKEEITIEQYDAEIEKATLNAIHWQEETGLDVLVHG